MRRGLLAICVLALAVATAAQPPVKMKTWKFTLPHGPLTIYLSVYANGTSSPGPISDAPTSEQIGPLEQVLREMPELGADQRKLVDMGMNILPIDALRKLAYACADDPECRFTRESPEKEKARVLVKLLNQSDAFAAYNEVFKRYGIRVEATAAEKITFVRFSTVPPRNARDRANARMFVLSGGQIGFRFSPINSTSSKRK
jgi:hypothetical protein